MNFPHSWFARSALQPSGVTVGSVVPRRVDPVTTPAVQPGDPLLKGYQCFGESQEEENDGGVVGKVLHDNVIIERSQDINDDIEAAIYAQHQGLTWNNDGLAPGSTVERKE